MIQAPATLALLGGGQLGRFFVAAAHELGYRVIVVDPDAHCPAGQIAAEHLIAHYDDVTALDHLMHHCSAATTEFENVPALTLAQLATRMPVYPSSDAVAIAQDRILEKSFLRDNGFITAPFATIVSLEDCAAIEEAFFPAILKIARLGYDGKGQARVNSVAQAQQAFRDFNEQPCVLEQRLALDLEISVVLARTVSGECATFAVAENSHRNGILDISIAPARISETLRSQAEITAQEVAQRLNYVGVLAIEFFICGTSLLINELAPRPHNSGHHTIDSCITNQFEQQLRALCDLPLGSAQHHSAAVMVNLLGDLWYGEDSLTLREPDWSQLTQHPNLKLHLYGKEEPRPGRKMGHFTVVDSTIESALATALTARRAIGVADSP